MQKIVYLILILYSVCAYADTIYFQKGEIRTDVKIVKESYKEIVYQMEEQTLKVSPHLIKRIDYSDAPALFLDGRNAMIQGNYEDAIRWLGESLEIAKQPPIVRDWIDQYVNFYLGKAYQEWADNSMESDKYKEAIGYYNKTVQIAADTIFLYECYFYKAQCYMKLKEYNSAKETLEQLKTSLGQTKNPPIEWIFQTTLLKGHIALAESNHSAAMDLYSEAEKTAKQGDLALLRNEAILAIGNCYISQKNFSKAESYFKKMEDQADEKNLELQAGIKNGLALCYLEQGDAKKSRKLAIEVFIKFPQAVNQQASALFIAGQSYEKLADKEPKSLERAMVYYTLIKTAHPNSEWAYKASQRIQILNK